MKFIIKLFPEITIKSRPVRKRLVARLQNNIQIILGRIHPEVKVSAFWDKIEVVYEGGLSSMPATLRDDLVDALKRIPGIQTFLEVEQHPLEDFHQAYERTRDAYAERLKGKTFKVRVRRSGKHEFTSVEMERYVGGGLRQHTEAAGVDVHKPEVWVDLEVRDDRLFIVTDIHPGLGGYPLGTQEPVLSLISGGFDSIVASWMTMRRGCKTHFLFFNLGGHAHEIGVKQVSLYLWKRYGSSARVKFITVPFEEVVGEILQSVDRSHMGVVLKRMMMRAADKVADRMNLPALVTGESIAQVSSQTLPNLNLIDNVAEHLVIRPLVTMDKPDIIEYSRQIGCFEFASAMPEFCGVISDKPTTAARKERVEREESGFDFEVLERALESAEVISIDEIVENQNINSEIQALTRVDANQSIIDIRAPHEEERKPLNLPGCTILKIPFYDLETKIKTLDGEREYLLYCEKGVMSQMHAQSLVEKGFENIGVYRPASAK
ncbi:tRNA uracil 4-sulfurtransferase ThiI [Marinobacterium lutimaris]|uniref:tRNA sulfurtransferase n=1 Tax=Marinobacterium lutimaris TaxID=568106 RepID=A0A1H6BFD2_9GAMM|nr:tRNA uracil 4-sulfurtransferase ThiI [Marinobacterium lutimaris]SEG58956.1 [ThiS-adenylate] sulfurtransferase [Marinobacterium lutimaris]